MNMKEMLQNTKTRMIIKIINYLIKNLNKTDKLYVYTLTKIINNKLVNQLAHTGSKKFNFNIILKQIN